MYHNSTSISCYVGLLIPLFLPSNVRAEETARLNHQKVAEKQQQDQLRQIDDAHSRSQMRHSERRYQSSQAMLLQLAPSSPAALLQQSREGFHRSRSDHLQKLHQAGAEMQGARNSVLTKIQQRQLATRSQLDTLCQALSEAETDQTNQGAATKQVTRAISPEKKLDCVGPVGGTSRSRTQPPVPKVAPDNRISPSTPKPNVPVIKVEPPHISDVAPPSTGSSGEPVSSSLGTKAALVGVPYDPGVYADYMAPDMLFIAMRAMKKVPDALAVAASYSCKSVELHPAHHTFPLIGASCHLQVTCYRKGVKGSHLNFRIPLPDLLCPRPK